MHNAEYWIKHLDLQPHREGGFYKEMYRSTVEVDTNALPRGFSGSRRLSTSIYYLLRSSEISKLHRLKSDELWYYHQGSCLKIIIIDQEGHKHTKLLGPNIDKAEYLQVLIPAGTIFGAEVVEKDTFSLLGCMVSPGFEFDDFDMYDKEELLNAFPKLADVIERFS